MPVEVDVRRAVVAFTGTMTDAPGRKVPRFPDRPDLVSWVAARIRAALVAMDAGEGVCSAARGADLLFLEALLELGGTATVLLPFPAEAFERTSVGYGWDGRLRAALANPRVEARVLAPEPPAEHELSAAFAACNGAIATVARDRAARRGSVAVLLAVWDGRPGDGTGGTGDFVRTWEEGGARAEIIRLPPVGSP